MRHAGIDAKWRIFLILNYLMVIPVAVLILRHLPTFSKKTNTPEEIMFSVILFIELTGILFNNCLSIYVVNRFFPDRVLTNKINRLLIVSLILDIIIVFTVLGVITEAISEISNGETPKTSGIVGSTIFTLFLGLTIYFLIMRTQINKYLNRASREKVLTDEVEKND